VLRLPPYTVVMLDRSLRSAFANFSTLVLAVALITVPVQLVLAMVFRNEIALSNLASQIASLPGYVQVHSVGPADLEHYRIAYWAVTGAEIALFPLFARAARRIVEVSASGGVPTVVDAYRYAFGRGRSVSRRGAVALVGGAVISIAVGVLCRLIGLTLVDPLAPNAMWLGVGLVEGVSRSLAAPFFLACWVGVPEAAIG
jgi:hypothetical protein